jgi:heat shock protein HtpX
MSTLKLKATMVATLAAIIGLSTLFFTIILSLVEALSIYTLALFVVFFNILQWLFAPYMIDVMYRVKKITRDDDPELYEMVERLSRKSGIKPPQLMIARIPIPNAFAYGSPITGNRVAVTAGLLNTLDKEEVEAVIGHELGHLKHRDVQVMMFVSILPALLYYIGYSLMWSSAYGRRDERGSSLAFIGFLSILLYWVLTLFALYLSRLREYYADRHSASVVEEGPRKLSEGLVKIIEGTERTRRRIGNLSNISSLKTLFISDPDSSNKDLRELYQTDIWTTDRDLVRKYLSRRVTITDELAELFSTHPNIIKRLKALQEIA